LHAESLERKHAEEALRHAQGDLARVSRITTLGELTASLAHEVKSTDCRCGHQRQYVFAMAYA